MDAVILAGGFAKRMWPLTKDRPKHLLEVAGRPMLSYTLDPLLEMDVVKNIYVSTNQAFSDHFRDFLSEGYDGKKVSLVVEPTESEGEKLGSIGGLNYLIEKEGIDTDCFVIGGDNLFEFHPSEAQNSFRRHGCDLVAVYDVGSRSMASLYGIVDVDESGRILHFLEKPKDPPSTLAATAFYIFRRETVRMVSRYIDEGGKRDALGHFIRYIVEDHEVRAWPFEGVWFDIGSLDSYREASEFFGR